MKLRNIFTMLTALLAFAFVGCEEESRFLDEVQVSQSYIALPVDGGSANITLNATDSWEIQSIPEWLTVTPASGNAGAEQTVKFSAEATTSTNEAMLSLVCGGATQILNVLQMADKIELPISSCADVIAGEDGTIFRAKGRVTSITNTQYGNWYLEDETGTILIYGTLDASGAEKNFVSLGIEVGDVVTCEGPKKTYGSDIELVNVTVIKIEKSLIRFDDMEFEIDDKGGRLDMPITWKGGDLQYEISAEATWLSFSGIGKDGDMLKYSFNVEPYEVMAGPRTATVKFTATLVGEEKTTVSEVEVLVRQYGITPEAISVTEALKATKGDWISVTGIVTGLNNKGFILTDKDGVSIQGYPNATPTVKIGDEILLTGSYTVYNKVAEIEKPVIRTISTKNEVVYPKAKTVTEGLIKEFDGKTVNSTEYVELTGVPSGQYGDILVEGTDGYGISPYQALKSFNYPADFEGKTVTIKGYLLQVYKNKTLRINVVSIEEAK